VHESIRERTKPRDVNSSKEAGYLFAAFFALQLMPVSCGQCLKRPSWPFTVKRQLRSSEPHPPYCSIFLRVHNRTTSVRRSNTSHVYSTLISLPRNGEMAKPMYAFEIMTRFRLAFHVILYSTFGCGKIRLRLFSLRYFLPFSISLYLLKISNDR